MSQDASSSRTPQFRIFLSHAGEDKQTIARPLYKLLREHNLSVFLDEESFRPGEHCPEVMEHAMETAPVGVFIMSPEFVGKEWPMRELLAFVRRYDLAKEQNEVPPLLIPIFYRLSTHECCDPAIFDKYSTLFLRHGLFRRACNNTTSLPSIMHSLDTAASLWAIRNDVGATNSEQPDMASTRERLIQIILNKILELMGIERSEPENQLHPMIGNQLSQQDVYTACNMVSPNPPRLTLNYDSLDTCEGRLRAAVLGRSGSRIVAVVATGKGGVGKTCALRGLGEDSEIKRAFGGGILYIELGKDAAIWNVVEGIAEIVDRTGSSKLRNVIKTAKSVKEASREASKWIGERACLFLVDDIWHVNGIDSEVLTDLGLMVKSNSRMVYTTRDKHFLKRANEVIEFEEKEPHGELSREMLMRHAGFKQSTILDDENNVAFEYFLEMCQGLPLGFGIIGGSILLYSYDCPRRQDAWLEFHLDVLSSEIDLMKTAAEVYGELGMIVDISLQVLEKRSGHEKFWYWFRALSVLQKQQAVPAEMLQKLWSLDTLRETKRVVQSLADVSVVQMTRRRGSISVKLHDLILDIAVRQAEEEKETESWFQTLVRNYMPCVEGKDRDESLMCAMTAPDSTLGCAWWKAENDGYIYNNVCRLLQKGGYVEQLLWLLSQPQWIVKRLLEDGVVSVEEDLNHGRAVCNGDASQQANHEKHLEMIGRAARLSALFVNNNPRAEEALFQLHGRLQWHATQSELTREMVQRMERCAPKPWLKASGGLLQQAGAGAQVVNVSGRVLCIREEPDAIWILSEDKHAHVGRYEKRNEYYKEEELEMAGWSPIECSSFLRDQRRVVTAHDDGRIGVWNRETGACEKTVAHNCVTHRRYVEFVVDGTRFACETRDHNVQLWETLSSEPERQTLEGHTRWVNCVAVSADGTRIVSGSRDKTVRVWDAHTGNAVGQPLQGHTGGVNCVAVSPDGTRIVSGGDECDQTVRMWNADTGTAVGQPLQGHTGRVNCVAVSPDGTRIVSGGDEFDQTVRMWNADTGNAVGQPLRGHTDLVRCVAVSADGTHIVSGGDKDDKTVRVWEADTGKAVGQPLQGHTGWVNCVAVSADGTRIVSGGDEDDKTVRVWDAHTGNAVGQPLRGHTREVNCVAASADGTRIVSGSDDMTVRVWDAHTGNAVGQPLRGHTYTVRCVAVSADGTRVVSGSDDSTVRVWDADTGTAVGQPLEGHTRWVSCVAVSADGTSIVSGSDDETVRVWDADTGNAVGQPLEGHTGWSECVAVSGDGTRIVSGGFDRTVRVWEADTGKAVGQPLQGHTGKVRCVAVSADGTRILSDDGGMRRLWAWNAGVYKCVLTSRDSTWGRITNALELTWSAHAWMPTMEREVFDFAADGSEIVLGTAEEAVDNIGGGDVYFTNRFRSFCRIMR